MKLTFENLYDKYNEYVMSIARSILNDDELAKDAFQETFVSVAQNIDTIDDNPHKAKSFIKKTAKNAAICIYRKYKVIRRVETAFTDENGNANNNEERHTRIPEELRTESFENELIKKYDMKILMKSGKIEWPSSNQKLVWHSTTFKNIKIICPFLPTRALYYSEGDNKLF